MLATATPALAASLVVAAASGCGGSGGPATIATVTESTSAAVAAKADVDCADFATQARAQRFFEAHGGRTSDPDDLDGDGNGVACESLPCPCRRGGTEQQAPQGARDRARIVEVTDGDTLKVRYRGRTRDVRLVGIDTPEIYGGTECGGPRASAAMKHQLQRGDSVTLTSDPSQDAVGRYGRLLRYAERDGIDVGRKQILRGWAHVYVYGGVPFARTRSYRDAQRKARRADRGAWGDCRRPFTD
jgi:endonuclease YncB( thermonuclease family)